MSRGLWPATYDDQQRDEEQGHHGRGVLLASSVINAGPRGHQRENSSSQPRKNVGTPESRRDQQGHGRSNLNQGKNENQPLGKSYPMQARQRMRSARNALATEGIA